MQQAVSSPPVPAGLMVSTVLVGAFTPGIVPLALLVNLLCALRAK